jgi:hypothetical protein
MVVPYSPWSNGGVERLNRVFLQAMRALLDTRGLASSADRVALVPVMQGCINKVLKVSLRGGRTPMELLTGLAPKSGVAHIAWLGVAADVATAIPESEVEHALTNMHTALKELWAEAVQVQQRRRRSNARAGGTLPIFEVGDLVLVAAAVRPDKLSVTWTGPHTVVGAASPFVYSVEPCLGPSATKPRRKEVHRCRCGAEV